jgi:hypothetical protein
MADTKTFGVKVPEELHQEATDLQRKLGLSGEGFLNELVRAYKLEKAKEEMPQVVEDLKELQTLTQRINNIYLNLGYRIDNITKAKDQELQEQLGKRESIISDLLGKVSVVEIDKETITTAYNDTMNQNDELNKRILEVTNMYNDNKALVEEYKSKNDTLAGLLNEYKTFKDQLEVHKELLADEQLRRIEVSDSLKSKELEATGLLHDLDSLKSKIEELKAEHKEHQEYLKQRHKEEIENLKAGQSEELQNLSEKASFEKDKALLDQDRKHQELINKLNEENNAKVRELLRENEAYNDKSRELLGQIEGLRGKNTKSTK